MLLEFGQRSPQRSFPEEDELGQALLIDRSHPAYRKSIRVRAARRKSQTFHPLPPGSAGIKRRTWRRDPAKCSDSRAKALPVPQYERTQRRVEEPVIMSMGVRRVCAATGLVLPFDYRGVSRLGRFPAACYREAGDLPEDRCFSIRASN